MHDERWAKSAAEQNWVVLHRPTGVVGPVTKWAPDYIDPNGVLLKTAVVHVGFNGDVLIADPERFIQLGVNDLKFHRLVEMVNVQMLRQVCETASAMGVGPDNMVEIIVAVLGSQLRRLAAPTPTEEDTHAECSPTGADSAGGAAGDDGGSAPPTKSG
jgi:hypothetical protein